MKKIVYVPLDERPCNYNFPVLLGEITEKYRLITPPMSIMGDKKIPADIGAIWQWLEKEVEDADGVILSFDTLVYGGIVPSRLHSLSLEECKSRLEKLKAIKLKKNIPIYGFNLIMRCPKYSSSDEEPDYYEYFGKEIFRQGYIKHKLQLDIATEEEKTELQAIMKLIPQDVLNDYISRRELNREVNKIVIDLVKEEVLDFLCIPQDDSAPYGLTAVDQQYVRSYIDENNVNLKVYMYPGADEVGCTLLARMVNKIENRIPLVYTRYSSVQGPFIIPLYEDRYLYESVKYQILAAGGLLASCVSEADIVLLINSPGETMMEASVQNQSNLGYEVFRNLIELVEFGDYVINKLKKPVVFGDIAYANGSDLQLVKLLREKKLLFSLAGYAGWNTSSNTLGTCIAQGMISSIYGNNQKNKDFLALRFVEDAGYCSFARKEVSENHAAKMNYNWFRLDGKRGEISNIVKSMLVGYKNKNLDYDNYEIEILDTFMPWNRMFEVGLKVIVNQK
jgi:hypothetical protein